VRDPFDMAMVAGSALPAAFTFLFAQLETLLARRREGRTQHAELTADQVPGELVGTLSLPLQPDEALLQERARELETYLHVLRTYAQDPSRVSPSDEALMAVLGQVRGALEEIHGQRLTFLGEDRPRSGPLVAGQYKVVSGDLVGMDASDAIRGDVRVEHDVGIIMPGGKVIGMSAPVIEDHPLSDMSARIE